MSESVMVSVLCTAYNHEKWIKDAIEGVLEQQTDFKYELIIHDDASTDNTASVIQQYAGQYPDVIRPIFQKENQFGKCSLYKKYLFPSARGKYIALCEGDDYWCDSHKLQRQVDFMESHPEYSMCMHNAIKRDCTTGKETLLNSFPEEGTYTQEEQIRCGLGSDYPAFASYLIRTKYLKEMPEFFTTSKVFDYPLRQYFANVGKIYYFAQPMSVYRAAVPHSYMSSQGNQTFYHTYTTEMIRFFENLDTYTEKRFHSILATKIQSDYLGYCISADESKGIEQAEEYGLDVGKIKHIYAQISKESILNDIKANGWDTDQIFIYGTSRIAMDCYRKMKDSRIKIKGFVVSDSHSGVQYIDEIKVYCISEIAEEKPVVILGVQPVNTPIIESILQKCGVTDYCKPYESI